MNKVLITGGSGLLGTRITEILLEKGIEVAHLSTRKSYKRKGVGVFYWDPSMQVMDAKAFEGVSSVLHLAGAGVADKRWTKTRKGEILDSRVESSLLLMNFLNHQDHQVSQFIGASAIGYYGNQDGILTEDNSAGYDFLATVCKSWEESYRINDKVIKKLIFRIGIVLAKDGGALPEMTKTLPFFIGILGSGKQVYSWIHVDDLAEMFIFALENGQMNGVFNAVAPKPVTQAKLAKEIASVRNTIVLPAPKIGLKLALGEMSDVLFLSQNCSANKILEKGFAFKFEDMQDAIRDLMQ
ncbi:TIGR01777 family oxidoreductase [Chitinophagales bacterium]|nr:TIGR01777 family oxidoreductase [Chitinophagales bacterium]